MTPMVAHVHQLLTGWGLETATWKFEATVSAGVASALAADNTPGADAEATATPAGEHAAASEVPADSNAE